VFISNNKMNISPGEVLKVVKDNNLHIYQNIWHYSFNDIFQNANFKYEKVKDGTITLYSEPHNQFSPLLIYTNSDKNFFLRERNAIQNEFDQTNEKYRQVFWFFRTTTFNNFLERRSKASSKPKKHFPTLESYNKIKDKIKEEIIFDKFNEKFFIENYNSLKQPEYLSGEELLELFKKNNPYINYDWLRIAYLNQNNETVVIAILVDDGKSLNLENIAAKRDSLGFGIFLCTELVKCCCEKNYYSFDAGVSGLYGNYKEKIFLDSWETYKKPPYISRYFKFWEISYWMKVKQKLMGEKNE